MSVCHSMSPLSPPTVLNTKKPKIGRNNPHINSTKSTDQFLMFCMGAEMCEVKDGGQKNIIAPLWSGLSDV